MYLIYTECVATCVHDVVLGICENMNEVIEIIWNFSRFTLHVDGNTYEENGNLIKIAKISENNYKILEKLYSKYEDKLQEYLENSRFDGWKDESCNVSFWYGVYDSEETKDILFINEDCEIIKNIVKESTLLD